MLTLIKSYQNMINNIEICIKSHYSTTYTKKEAVIFTLRYDNDPESVGRMHVIS